MTLTEFNNLDLNRKSDIVWEWGYLITNHKSGDYNTIIFSLEDFFIETLVFIPENRTISIKAIEKHELSTACVQQIKADNTVLDKMLSQLKLYSSSQLSVLN